MKIFILNLIWLYQKTISPDHGLFRFPGMGRCRFYPSCSEYTHEAIRMNGVVKGSVAGFFRILRCNPLFEGGLDPVPLKK